MRNNKRTFPIKCSHMPHAHISGFGLQRLFEVSNKMEPGIRCSPLLQEEQMVETLPSHMVSEVNLLFPLQVHFPPSSLFSFAFLLRGLTKLILLVCSKKALVEGRLFVSPIPSFTGIMVSLFSFSAICATHNKFQACLSDA